MFHRGIKNKLKTRLSRFERTLCQLWKNLMSFSVWECAYFILTHLARITSVKCLSWQVGGWYMVQWFCSLWFFFITIPQTCLVSWQLSEFASLQQIWNALVWILRKEWLCASRHVPSWLTAFFVCVNQHINLSCIKSKNRRSVDNLYIKIN